MGGVVAARRGSCRREKGECEKKEGPAGGMGSVSSFISLSLFFSHPLRVCRSAHLKLRHHDYPGGLPHLAPSAHGCPRSRISLTPPPSHAQAEEPPLSLLSTPLSPLSTACGQQQQTHGGDHLSPLSFRDRAPRSRSSARKENTSVPARSG